jgi:ankyrin repeat protein
VSELTGPELDFLHHALDLAREGRADELAALVDAGLPVNLTNPAGDTLLILAAYHPHPDAVAALLQRGADTERENDRGQTALGAAAFRQHARCVELLLDAGADPAGGARSALDLARFFGLDDMLELLEAARPGIQQP